jgi:hypothetical protein
MCGTARLRSRELLAKAWVVARGEVAGVFAGRIVVVIDGIVADDLIAALDQPSCDVKADEASRPCNEKFHRQILRSLSRLGACPDNRGGDV